jgi:hypothetical protein
METVERRLAIWLATASPARRNLQPSTDGHLSLAGGVRASSWSEHSPSVPGLCAAGQPHLVLIKRGWSHSKSHLHGPVKRGRQTGSTVWRSRWPWARVNPKQSMLPSRPLWAPLPAYLKAMAFAWTSLPFHHDRCRRAYDCLVLSIFSSDWSILFSCRHARNFLLYINICEMHVVWYFSFWIFRCQIPIVKVTIFSLLSTTAYLGSPSLNF